MLLIPLISLALHIGIYLKIHRFKTVFNNENRGNSEVLRFSLTGLFYTLILWKT
jgi:hypothetical protein